MTGCGALSKIGPCMLALAAVACSAPGVTHWPATPAASTKPPVEARPVQEPQAPTEPPAREASAIETLVGKAGSAGKGLPADPLRAVTIDTVALLDVTRDRRRVVAEGFHGSVFLVMDEQGDGPEWKDPPQYSDIMKKYLEAGLASVRKEPMAEGLNRRAVCVQEDGAVSVAEIALISGKDTRLGFFPQMSCRDVPAFFDSGEECGSEEDGKGNPRSCRERFELPSAVVESRWLGDLCLDTGRYEIVVKDRKGGKLRFRDVLNAMGFEADVDGDGRNELYLIGYQCCSGWMRIYKIVFDR
jgi:hypothetical protein